MALLNFWFFLCFSLGIVIGHYFSFLFLSLILSLFSLVAVYLFYRKNRFTFSDVSILFFFFFLGTLWILPYSSYEVERFLYRENQFTIKVISLPQEGSLKNTFSAQIKRIKSIPVELKVKVMDYTKKMEYLHSYKIRGKLSKRIYGRSNFYYLWVKATSSIEEVPLSVGDKFGEKAVGYFLSVFRKNLSQLAYHLLSSIFLGRRELLPKEVKDVFKKAGAIHLLAISGLHMGLVSIVCFYFLKFFRIRFPLRIIISTFLLWIYTGLVGINPPSLRSTIMYSVFGLSYLLKRRAHPLNSLGLAGLICLFLKPYWLFDVGFQFSFIAIFSIIFGYRFFSVKIKSGNIVSTYFKNIFFSSLFVHIVISPLTAYYFNYINFSGILTNIIVIPLFASVISINLIFLLFSPIAFLAKLLGETLSLAVFLFIKSVEIFSTIRLFYIPVKFSLFTLLFYYISLFFCIITIYFIRFYREKNLTKNVHPSGGH